MPHLCRLLLRLIVRAIVATTIIAVLLGRGAARPAAHSPQPPSASAPPRYYAFNGVLFPDHARTQRIIDTETGAVSLLQIPGAGGFDLLSVSPWRDAGGQHHMAGCWRDFTNDEHGGLPGVMGVARVTFPGGRVLDRIAIDPVLNAPPCWFPDRSDRILFAAGDGQLYLLNFREAGGPGGAAPAPRPQRVRWSAADPGSDSIFLRDPCWPGGPALGGRLVAALYSPRSGQDPSLAPLESRLWWLQLSPDATEVEAAGRLIGLGADATAEGDDEILPTVGTTRDGLPMLAYVVNIRSPPALELRTAPISAEGTSQGGTLRVQPSSIRRLANVGVLAVPAFSPDGQWIYAVVRDRPDGETRIKRFAAAPGDPHRSLADRGK